MSYRVNGRNLSVSRLMVRGKNADKRLKYIHVSAKGTSVITPVVVARVSLPRGEQQPYSSAVIPQASVDKMTGRAGNDEIISLPEGEPAVNGPHFMVPQIDTCFPDPVYTTATFTCNGDLLRKLLTVACEVSSDSDKTIRLRICKDLNSLRIDTYRQPGTQEFCGALKGLDYDGDYIPGELPTGVPKVEKKPQQRGMLLKVSSGRKFRGVGE
jgi:hypothetical protein